MKIAYGIQKRISKKRKDLISVIDIACEYDARGLQLTVRQAYYQLVARGVIPNSAKEYTKIVDTVKIGRLAGLLDWNAFEDRGRYVRENTHWQNPEEILSQAVNQYHIDIRATQNFYIEAWIEKDSLVSILEDVCKPLDVPCFSCRGFASITALYEAAERLNEYENPVIFYAGDHDPSGLTIAKNIEDTLTNTFQTQFLFKRIAITPQQIKEMNLPSFPAKEQDKNYPCYVENTGLTEAWELDALPPEILMKNFKEAISEYTDFSEIEKLKEKEKEEKCFLKNTIKELCNF